MSRRLAWRLRSLAEPARVVRAVAGCVLRGHSPDPRTVRGAGAVENREFTAECYFCRAPLKWGPADDG